MISVDYKAEEKEKTSKFATHSLFFLMFRYYAVVMAIFAILTGIIFIQLFSRTTVESTGHGLLKQAKQVAARVSQYVQDRDTIGYPAFIEVLDETETADVWIVSNPDHPLANEYVNIDLDDEQLAEIKPILNEVFRGHVYSMDKYSDTYQSTYIFAGAPVIDAHRNVVGAVLFNQRAESQQHVIESGTRIVIFSTIIALLVAVFVAIFFAGSITRPISKMRKTALRLAEGDYTAHTGIEKKGELGDLARTVDILSDKLHEAEDERKKLDQMRIDFFANVSHELRTPITVVRAYTETLADGIVTDEPTRMDYYSKMLSEMESMQRLVGDLLALSKMQNPDFEIEKEPINLVQVFDDIDRSAGALAAKKNMTVNHTCDSEVYLMYGDYDRIRQMFMVIVDNAVKFSNEGSTIDISIEEKEGLPVIRNRDSLIDKTWNIDGDIYSVCGKKLVVKIRDHGVGISKQELPYIFDKFYRSKLRQNAKGSGLGLAIARQIALKHDGTISVASEVGEGTEFTFEFPEIVGT